MIDGLNESLGISVGIQDASGDLLWGDVSYPAIYLKEEAGDNRYIKHRITLKKKVVGWVVGEKGVNAVASLINYIVNKEHEEKMLSSEVLERYSEISIIHDVAQMLSSDKTFKEKFAYLIEKAAIITKASGASILIYNKKNNNFDILVSIGVKHDPVIPLKAGEGIAGAVFLAGESELIEDVFSDPRYVSGPDMIYSMICAPVKKAGRAVGVIKVSRDKDSFAANDLTLINILAFHSASLKYS